MPKTARGPETTIDLSFPLAGVDVSARLARQPARKIDGDYARTTPFARNVRSYDPISRRRRGGSRAGLSKFVATQPGSTASLIQCLAVVVGAGYTPPGGTTQASQSNRVVTLVAVVDGVVWVCDAGGTTWTQATNGSDTTIPLSATGLLRAAVLNQKLYFFDGSKRRYYDPSTGSGGTVGNWIASGGTMPANAAGTEFCRLGCTWRGRLVQGGLEDDPQNWFMSAVGDPNDYDSAPESATGTQAVAGNNSDLGLLGEPLRMLIPFSDDVLVAICDASIWQFSGDPMDGGQLDRISDATGGMYGNAWAKDAAGNIYFLSNRGNVYAMAPGQQPVPISESIDPLLQEIDSGATAVSLFWDEGLRELRLFITETAAAAETTHYTYEKRTAAWWPDTFGDDNFNPLAGCVFDGNEVDDRCLLLGSWDGYVRKVDPAAADDDGRAIDSRVALAGFHAANVSGLSVRDFHATLGGDSDPVYVSAHRGDTAEEALNAAQDAEIPVPARDLPPAFPYAKLTARLNPTHPIRCGGRSVYLMLASEGRWAFEEARVHTMEYGR